MTHIPARIAWAVHELAPAPNHRILEIGAGTAATAHVLAPLLPRGQHTIVDRSPTAVARIIRAAAPLLESGRLTVNQGTLEDLHLALPEDAEPYDAALCVDVNQFWTSDPRAGLHHLRRRLNQGGTLLIAYGQGAQAPKRARILDTTQQAMASAGFRQLQQRCSTHGFAVSGINPAAD